MMPLVVMLEHQLAVILVDLCLSVKRLNEVLILLTGITGKTRLKQIEDIISERTKGVVFPEVLKDNGAGICAIDWHLEMGEIGVSLEEIRDGYRTRETDGGFDAESVIQVPDDSVLLI